MIRNLNTRRFNASKTKSNKLTLDLLNKGLFYGLVFFDKSKDIIPNTERLTVKPTVTINGNDIFFDYSSYSSNLLNILNLKFKYATSGDIFTITDGSYENPVQYVDDVNITGTYIFQEMLNETIIKAKINSAPDVGTVTLFQSNYFVGPPQLTLSSSIKGDINVYGVKNLLGSSSKNSLIALGPRVGDQIKFNTKLNTKTFTIKNLYRVNNVEYLFFEEECVVENNFSESIFIEHLREKVKETPQQSIAENDAVVEEEPLQPQVDSIERIPQEQLNLLTGRTTTTQPRNTKTGPFAVQGYYPLYTTPEGAIEASPDPTLIRDGETTAGYHVHVFNGKEFYMPNGLIKDVTFYHGNYSTITDSAIREVRERIPRQPTQRSTPVNRTPEPPASTPPTPPPASPPPAPPPSAPSGGGYGY
mgnify:CR=1 FL=1